MQDFPDRQDRDDQISVGPPRAAWLPIVLILIAAAALPAILALGDDLAPEPDIAGRYAVSSGEECVGGTFDLRQSGQFVSLTLPDGDKIAQLRAREGELSGEVECSDGDTLPLEATASGTQISGSLGVIGLSAERTREFNAISGREPTNPSNVDGDYSLSPESLCLGRDLSLDGGEQPTLETGYGTSSQLTYSQGQLSGDITCIDGGDAEIRGVSTGNRLELEIERLDPGPNQQRIEQAVAETQAPLGERAAAFFLAVVVVLGATFLCASIAQRLGQPRVMGAIVAGILLGPTFLGAIAPDLQAEVFSTDVLDVLGVVANLGLVIYVFIIGLEMETDALRGRRSQVVTVGIAAFVVPLLLGAAAALPTFELLAPDTDFAAFALFLGISMSITAFPVLARILDERGMLGGTLGTAALAAAAIDDLLGWLLITVATALALAGSAKEVLPTLGWFLLFAVVMYGLVRPLLRRAGARYDAREAGASGAGWIALVFAGILLSAYATEKIGVALIIGALVMGTAMPREMALTAELRRGSETFVMFLLLPLFFAYTGLRTDIGTLAEPQLWLIAAALLAIAIAGKLVAATLAARAAGMRWRPAAILGTLMNTRGLTELIVLNLALETGVLSEALFTALVLMALVTTFMAGPLLRLLDPNRLYGPDERGGSSAPASAPASSLRERKPSLR